MYALSAGDNVREHPRRSASLWICYYDRDVSPMVASSTYFERQENRRRAKEGGGVWTPLRLLFSLAIRAFCSFVSWFEGRSKYFIFQSTRNNLFDR